ncbi:molybdenum cofactor cytidylyltransferase [Mucilaginibacter gossypiicola]|uniref:Molybdenum cofactor cytidylyltransferase n=1 Tax=Mucilaginibacter gossypiicola TaxID=551995 RepID=A0A1H8H6H2_9SPHI|nr:nucleotidyltransferase family protein [Mucilaginibacter gossypiicola]SEN51826.1 molybdenum cofactor cytidylyltransferase [Mucilaginibacter gossypiicola]
MTGIIILAAGASSRFGSPKQNLIYQGKTLLQRTIQTALTCLHCEKVIVVLGANEGIIRPNIDDQLVHVIYNPHWQEGMGSSIKTGLTEMLKLAPHITSVILMLCDQPFVDQFLLSQLLEKKEVNDCGIIACGYRDVLGAPALFDVKYFPELLKLEGPEGAKKVIEAHADDVFILPFPLGAIDIDTTADLERLNQAG